jgi:hypothetical protein
VIGQSRGHLGGLRHVQLAEDRQGTVPSLARRGGVAFGSQEHAEAVERPALPGAKAEVAERRQTGLQAAERLLQAALLPTDVAEGVQGEGLDGTSPVVAASTRLCSRQLTASSRRPCLP